MSNELVITFCKNILSRSEDKNLPYHTIDLVNRRINFLANMVDKNPEFEEFVPIIWISVSAMSASLKTYGEEVNKIVNELSESLSEGVKALFKDHLLSKENSIISQFNRAFNFSTDPKHNLNEMRRERIQLMGPSFNDRAWNSILEKELELLGKDKLELNQAYIQEQENSRTILLKNQEKYQKAIEAEASKELYLDNEELKKLKKKLVKVKGVPERGIESWFRLTSRNLYTRLQIVDTKAGMLITSNSLIISIVLGSLYTHLDEDPHLIFAVASLILTNIVSITFAILAAIPRLKGDKGISNPTKSNLMTFEDFHALSKGEYQIHVKEIMSSGEVLYDSITTNIYQLGQKLAQKYKLIRLSFLVLLYGITISIMMFGVCHLMGL